VTAVHRAAPYPPPGMVGPRLIAAWALRTQTSSVRVDGIEHVPRDGPVLLLARHYHHLLDGAVVVAHLRRPVHIVVGLDWTAGARQRRWMERACRWARYPVILRPATTGTRGGYDARETSRYLRSGLGDAANLLRDGRVVLVFPEGYPVIDPAASEAAPRRPGGEGMLPFAAGFRTILAAAQRRGARDVTVVPLGFRYERVGARWNVTARFGVPLAVPAAVDDAERAVRSLSQ
jgi:1-acyl-sn-glycerol-3-phosphate acyltransferase